MNAVVWVALGGALGSVARYSLAGWVMGFAGPARFPWGTFAVNVIGCLVVGVMAGLADKHDLISPTARLFLFTGLAGGFTTFSAFGLETFGLLKRGETLVAIGYVVSSVLVGVLVLAAGYLAVPKPA